MKRQPKRQTISTDELLDRGCEWAKRLTSLDSPVGVIGVDAAKLAVFMAYAAGYRAAMRDAARQRRVK